MTLRKFVRRSLVCACAALSSLSLGATRSHAAEEETALARERCLVQIADTFLDDAPKNSWESLEPSAAIDDALVDPRFVDKVAGFLNFKFSAKPGADAHENAVYAIAKHVVGSDRPYHELFDGPLRVTDDGSVVADESAVGFFTDPKKIAEYAGNEPEEGLKLVEANRILKFTVGYSQKAVMDNVDGQMGSRLERAACKSCHNSGPNGFGLELIARALPRRNMTDRQQEYVDAKYGPQKVVGATVSSRADVVKALVSTEDFKHQACALSFEFLYGRKMNACEDTMYQACVAAFGSKGTLRSAIAAIAKDKEYCQ